MSSAESDHEQEKLTSRAQPEDACGPVDLPLQGERER